MPKPAYPQAGEPITSAWAEAITDFAGEKLRFVRLPYTALLSNVNSDTAVNLLEVTPIPANNPAVKYASIVLRSQDDNGADVSDRLIDYDGTVAFQNQTSGATQRGGLSGEVMVAVGGVNNRQIKWQSVTESAAHGVSISCNGYWVRETP